MKDLQIIIQHMLADRKNHIRVISMITALSLIMMFVMPFTEIMRAQAEGEEYFTAVVTSPPGDAVDFGGKVNTININGKDYTNASGNIVDAGNGNNYQFSIVQEPSGRKGVRLKVLHFSEGRMLESTNAPLTVRHCLPVR